MQLKKRFADAGMRIIGSVLNEHQLPELPREKWSVSRIRQLVDAAVQRLKKTASGPTGVSLSVGMVVPLANQSNMQSNYPASIHQ